MKKTLLFAIMALTTNAFAQIKQSATQMYNPIFNPMENTKGRMDAVEQYEVYSPNDLRQTAKIKTLTQGSSNYLVDSLFRWQWDNTIGWELVNKSTNRVYDANKNLISEIIEQLNVNIWAKYQINYTYNANNKLTMQISQKWNGSAWVKDYQYTYTYDAKQQQA
jgi:hypothetical protein